MHAPTPPLQTHGTSVFWPGCSKKRWVADMELTSQELDLLYGLTRFESIALRQGDYTKQPEDGSYADAIYKLDTKLTANFNKRNQTVGS